jgi:hypothetical protein
MKMFVYYDTNGRITLVTTSTRFNSSKNFVEVEEQSTQNFSDFYVNSKKQLIEKPEKPSDNCFFDYKTKNWVEQDINVEQLALSVKNKRDQLLRDSDWTQLPDSPVDREAWGFYRQKLRDIPTADGFPTKVNWPNSP